MEANIDQSWKNALNGYFSSLEFRKLKDFIKQKYVNKTIYPIKKNIFNAFISTPFDSIKIVILGQDPYHNPGQAHGLSFSVPDGVIPPPSLKNIYKEIERSLGIKKDMSNGNLLDWAQQGVLLLNAVLSVEENKPGSHAHHGWEDFTDHVIQKISQEKEHCVFLLWGAYAQKKKKLVDESKHLVLTSAHPSPLSAYRGFLGNNHFALSNLYLMKYGKKPIKW